MLSRTLSTSLSAKMIRLCCLIALLSAAGVAGAHIYLTSVSLSNAVSEIKNRQHSIEVAKTNSEKAEALFELGRSAENLQDLLNEEYSMHGFEQAELLTAGTEMAAEAGASITWSDYHERFFYDGDAFRRYLELAPDGPLAAESHYQLIVLGFYQAVGDDFTELEQRAADKRSFINRYPRFAETPRVSMFLGIDYRDLWRLCREKQDAGCVSKYERLARREFRSITASYPNSEISEVARRMLERFEAEVRSKTG